MGFSLVVLSDGYSLAAVLPPQGYEIKVPCLNGKRVSKLVGCVLFLILVVDFN